MQLRLSKALVGFLVRKCLQFKFIARVAFIGQWWWFSHRKKKIQYYDSLNGDGHILVDAVLTYLDDIHEECKMKTASDGKVDNDEKEEDKEEEETSPDKKKKESALRKLGWVTCPRSPEGTPEQPND